MHKIDAKCKAGSIDVANLTVLNYDAKQILPARVRKLRTELPDVVVSTITTALDEARKSYRGSLTTISIHSHSLRSVFSIASRRFEASAGADRAPLE